MKPSPSEPGPGESAQYQPPLPCRVSMFEPSPAAGLLHTCLLKEPVLEPLGSLPSSPVPLHRLPNHHTGCRPCGTAVFGKLSKPQCSWGWRSFSELPYVFSTLCLGVSSTRSWNTVGMQDLSPGLMVRLLEKSTFLFCSKRFAFYEKNHST